MLTELNVRNFGIVKDLRLNFRRGLTVFSGETGAGKSLLLDAMTLLLGVKARSELVRDGADSAEIEGLFDLAQDPDKQKVAEDMGFPLSTEEGPWLMVRREISGRHAGRNRIWIQGRSATRAQLQALLGDWVEVSGQHEFLRLGNEHYLLDIVDQFASLKDEVKSYFELYERWRETEARCAALRKQESGRESRLDFLKFQIDEMEKAGISATVAKEEMELVALRARLGSIEKLQQALSNARDALDDSGDRSGLSEVTKSILTELSPFENLGEDMKNLLLLANQMSDIVSELEREVSRALDRLEADPEQLEGAQERLSRIQRLKRKHDTDAEGLANILQSLKDETQELSNSEVAVAELEKLSKALMGQMERALSLMSAARESSALELTKLWQKDVRMLGMAKARIEIVVSKLPVPGPRGIDRVQISFSANPGEAMRDLSKVASGGELSRIMLALKNLISGRSELGVFLFDEVDAGVGGETAQIVAERLKQLATHNQVLVITHLAQIAAKADEHFCISKIVRKGRTLTEVAELSTQGDREQEIARMLGSQSSKAARSLAREMIREANL